MSAVASDRSSDFPLGASLTLADLAQDPIGLAKRLRTEEPVSWLASESTWLVAPRELVEQVTRDEERFTADSDLSTDRQVLGRTMLTTDGPAHDDHRQPFVPSMSAKHVQRSYTEIIDDRVEELIRGLRPAARADLMAEFAEPLGLRVVGDVLGFGYPDQAVLSDLLNRMLSALKLEAGDEARAEASDVRRRFAPEVTAALDRARTEAPDSVLGMVANTQGGRLDEQLIIDNTINLVFGGAETTATLVSTSLWTLLTNPEQLREVMADLSLLPNAIDEATRLRPAFGIVLRWATQDTVLGGIPISAGERLYPLLMAANRDPEFFEDPDAYDIHRRNARKNTSFGRGTHFCIGQTLARLVAIRAIEGVLEALPGLHLLPEGSEGPVGFEFHRVRRLDVSWDESPSGDAHDEEQA